VIICGCGFSADVSHPFFFAEIKKGKKERIFSENPERKGKMRTRAISNKTQIKTHHHNFFIVPKRRMHPDEVFLG
jgi:hypothetical protein